MITKEQALKDAVEFLAANAGTSEGAKKGWETKHSGPGGYRLGELEDHQNRLRSMKEFFHPSVQKAYHEAESERRGIVSARRHLEHSDKDEGLYDHHKEAKQNRDRASKEMMKHLSSGTSNKDKFEALRRLVSDSDHYFRGVNHVLQEHEHGTD